MQGRAVETIEGMANGAELHPLQQKFLDHAALQCGVYTRVPDRGQGAARTATRTVTKVRYWLAGNLCRCTGYDKIVRAVLDTAAEMRKLTMATVLKSDRSKTAPPAKRA